MAYTNTDLAGQAAAFFSNIFYTGWWPSRWNCGHWTDFHGWLYIISELMIWAAYFAIPLLLFKIINKRQDLPFPKIFWLFSAFILLCGGSHLLDAMIFWWPAYRLSALLRLATGLVSVSTVFALYKILPSILSLRTAAELEAEVTQRKKIEEELRIQLAEHEKTKELLRMKDQFINLAAHELKTPLTSLRGYIQIAASVAVKDGMIQQQEILSKAGNQSQKLTKLINDLFNATKMQIEKSPLTTAQFNLTDLLRECADQFKVNNPNCEIDLEGPENIEIDADRGKIEQVVCNLLSNAIKFSPTNNRATIKTEILGNDVCVTIIDFGVGISAEKLPFIFDRDKSLKKESQYFSGLGLGLYISNQIVQQHKGEMGVESVLHEGSQFWFRIPRHQ